MSFTHVRCVIYVSADFDTFSSYCPEVCRWVMSCPITFPRVTGLGPLQYHHGKITAILIPCWRWLICSAPSSVRICGIPLVLLRDSEFHSYQRTLYINFMASALQQAITDIQLNDYITRMLIDLGLPLRPSNWYSQLWSSLRLDMITVSDPCLCIFSCWMKSTLTVLTFSNEVPLTTLVMVHTDLTEWRSFQIEYIWVSNHFSGQLYILSNTIAEQALDTGVNTVCSRMYQNIHNLGLGLIVFQARYSGLCAVMYVDACYSTH